MPRVSVVIPSHNCGHVIGRAIDSVLAQTYRDFEIIVVDDASTDGTERVVRRHGERVGYLRREANSGAAAARNDGIRASTGELIAFLDADDVYLPRRLEAAVTALDCQPELGAVYADCQVRDLEGRIVAPSMIDASGCWKRIATWRDVARYEPMHTNTITIRRRCLDEIGLFEEALRRGQDSELWLRLSYRYPVGQLREVVAIWNRRQADWSGVGVALRAIRVWRIVLEWVDGSNGADVRFARSRLARAHWLLALALRSRQEPDALSARREAVSICVSQRFPLHLFAGSLGWHSPSVIFPMWAAGRCVSRLGRRALATIVR